MGGTSTPPNFSLRQASTEDIPFLISVFLDTLREAITEARGEWNPEQETSQFRGQLDLAATRVITIDGIPIGFVTAPQTDAEITVHTICISIAHQNQGIGSEVTRSIIARAHATNRSVVLYVLKANPGARRLYQRLGFNTVGESENHYLMKHGTVSCLPQ